MGTTMSEDVIIREERNGYHVLHVLVRPIPNGTRSTVVGLIAIEADYAVAEQKRDAKRAELAL